MRTLLFAALVCLSLGSAHAAPADDAAAQQQAEQQLLKPQKSKITLPGATATLDLPANFRYLDTGDTSRVLEAWRNPPGAQTLDMIIPAGVGPMSQMIGR